MILVDTSVWVSHLRVGNANLLKLLNQGEAVCHSFIVGELACGNLANRSEILSLVQTLPMAIEAEHDEVLHFIDHNRLMGRGLGLIDVHLIASAQLSSIPIWTLDKKLEKVCAELGIGVNKKLTR